MSLNLRATAPHPCVPSPTLHIHIGGATSCMAVPTKRLQARVRASFLDSDASSCNSGSSTQMFIECLREFAVHGWIREGKTVHGLLLKTDFGDQKARSRVVLLNHLAYMYVKQSNLVYAQRVFYGIPNRNVFSWTVMIGGFTEHGLFSEAFRLFCEMLVCGIWPDKFAYSSVLQACLRLHSIDYGKMVHSHIAKTQISQHDFVNSVLLNMYTKFGDIDASLCLFQATEEHNQVMWNTLVAGLANNDLNLEAYHHYCKMKEAGFEPNMYTFASVLKAIRNLGDVGKGKEVHQDIKMLGMESNVVVATALINMYSKSKCLSEARALFDANYATFDVNTPWNAMMSGYLLNEKNEEALELFQEMCHRTVPQDCYTYGCVFNACANVKLRRNLQVVHGRLIKGEEEQLVDSIVIVNNALCDAYFKCELVEDAEKVFERMKEKDVVSWTTMITAYAKSSEVDQALFAFSSMRDAGINPNQFTLASVLAACANLCYLEFGRQIHGLLLKLRFHNYDCTESSLVDMYAKCGSLGEAEKVFNKILIPDVVSWTAVISACSQHGLVEKALQLFSSMEESGVQPNEVTFLCVLFACSHGGLLDYGLYYFQAMKEKYRIVPKMEHYACIVDLLGRLGRLDDALNFINTMPIEPSEMVWQNLLGACRVHCDPKMGEVAAKKILALIPEHSAPYVLLYNTYVELGNPEDGLSIRDAMKRRGIKKEPGCSWIFVRGRMHRFFAGDQNHPQKNEIFKKLDDLQEKVESRGYAQDLSHPSSL